MARKPPNLLFLTTDHQRADSLGMVQAGVEVTPHLNRLAAGSAVFARAYNACPLCVPARTALATGQYPTRNGVVFNDWAGTTAGDHKTLQEYLAGAGYTVAHVGVHHIRVRPPLPERVRFARWIDDRDYAEYAGSRGVDPKPTVPHSVEVIEMQAGKPVAARYSNTRVSVWPGGEEHFRDSFFARESVDFLRRQRDEPFALFVCLWAPHPPLQVPEPYASRFAPERLVLPPNVGQPARGEPPGRRRGVAAQLAEGVPMEAWRQVWAAHLGLVHLADAALGRILTALDEAGRADDTVVLFTSDHGDHLGQHRLYQKMEMYEQAIRVPLVLRTPGGGTQIFDPPVSHLDVLPTLLDLLGIAAPDGIDGVSLAGSVRTGAPPAARPVFSQYSGNPTVGDIRRAVVTARYKYVYDPADSPELYDLRHDPLETENRARDPAHAPVLRELHEECRAWAASHGDWVTF